MPYLYFGASTQDTSSHMVKVLRIPFLAKPNSTNKKQMEQTMIIVFSFKKTFFPQILCPKWHYKSRCICNRNKIYVDKYMYKLNITLYLSTQICFFGSGLHVAAYTTDDEVCMTNRPTPCLNIGCNMCHVLSTPTEWFITSRPMIYPIFLT